jgi:hypothetical protein
MRQWLRRRVAVAVFVFALALMSAMSLTIGLVAVSRAQVWCPVGWYYNNYTRSCQPTPGPTVTACVSATGRRGYVSGGVCIGN